MGPLLVQPAILLNEFFVQERRASLRDCKAFKMTIIIAGFQPLDSIPGHFDGPIWGP